MATTHRILASKASTLRLSTTAGKRRWFQSLAEFDKWRSDVRSSTLQPKNLVPLNLQESAPFLHSVFPMAEHLKLEGTTSTSTLKGNEEPKNPRDAFLQCTYPLETDALLRNSVTDLSNWSSFRLGKYYDTVDALTADVAYRHCGDKNVALVTAGHYHSRKFSRTNIRQDVILRSYMTNAGTSSMEVRTDAIQRKEDGAEVLVNVCHTMMVALDKDTGKSLGKVGRRIPKLILETEDDGQRDTLARQHATIRRQRQASAMQLRSPVSNPPTQEEFEQLHELHRSRVLQQHDDTTSKQCSVADYTFRSSTVIFPENRNVHGKLFGGFVMEEAQNLAQYTACFFSKGQPIIPLGIDEAIFLQPISIGDMVTFTARLVHSTDSTCRVMVVVEVRDPAHRDRVPLRSNRLLFVFGGSDFSPVIPETYSEILMHMDAQRRHSVEGPTDQEVHNILQESRNLEKSTRS